MEKIILNRGFGKTYQLIKKSAKTGDHIVCKDRPEVDHIKIQAWKMHLQIPTPITYNEFLGNNYEGLKVNGFLIDNAELLLEYISNVPVNAISLNP